MVSTWVAAARCRRGCRELRQPRNHMCVPALCALIRRAAMLAFMHTAHANASQSCSSKHASGRRLRHAAHVGSLWRLPCCMAARQAGLHKIAGSDICRQAGSILLRIQGPSRVGGLVKRTWLESVQPNMGSFHMVQYLLS